LFLYNFYLVECEFDDCVFERCGAENYGGGIYVEFWNNQNFTRCIFIECSADNVFFYFYKINFCICEKSSVTNSGFGGGIFIRTNPPTDINKVGLLYIKHCYFENNTALTSITNPSYSGVGRGIIYFIVIKIISLNVDIVLYDENGTDDKWDTFVKSDYKTYFLHSLSRTKFETGMRNPRLFYISDDPNVSINIINIIIDFFYLKMNKAC
jgi:hypothetical protein